MRISLFIRLPSDVVYTAKDKKKLQDHLHNPYVYVESVFNKNRPIEQT